MPTLTVMPSGAVSATQAARAYSDTANVSGAGGGCGEALGRAIGGAVDTARTAESRATEAIAGHGSLTDVVSAVSRAELALQTTVAIRDKVVAAYQDIMRMPI